MLWPILKPMPQIVYPEGEDWGVPGDVGSLECTVSVRSGEWNDWLVNPTSNTK
jgi:hypothetical protein